MKKSLLVLAAAMLSVPAFANGNDTGVANFVEGMIGQSTCAFESGSQSVKVNLGKVWTNELKKAGDTIGRVPFTIKLVGCPEPYINSANKKIDQVSIQFVGSPNIVAERGTLKNTVSDGAKNVELQLLNSEDESVINLSNNDNAPSANLSAITETHEFNFTAQYLSQGSATAGKFETSVPFTFEYK